MIDDYEIDIRPLSCPECGSHNVTYTVDASVAYTQKKIGDDIMRNKLDASSVSTFDTVLDAECLNCHHTDTSGDVSSAWWEA